MSDNITMYVITHKEFNEPKIDGYVPIQAGAAINKKLNYITDATGENISEKNKNYCELTVLYWIWKNQKDDVVGISHYRRYFFKNRFCNNSNKAINKEQIKKYLEKYDVIIPEPEYIYKYTIEDEYKEKHHIKDLHNCRKIIDKIYPEYIESFDTVMKSKEMHQYNMIVANKDKFDEYAKWLFDILFEVEKITDISNYDDYNKRIYGFLSERLFNVWLHKNSDLKVKQLPVNITDKTYIKWQFKNRIKKMLLRR